MLAVQTSFMALSGSMGIPTNRTLSGVVNNFIGAVQWKMAL